MNDHMIQVVAALCVGSSLAFIIATFIQMWFHRQSAAATLIIVDEADQYVFSATAYDVQLEAERIVNACWEMQ